jgi:predicted permease
MLSTLAIVLPIFALIFIGYACRRIEILGPNATTELNRFVVYLALPALLFDIVAHAIRATFYQPGFIGVFGLGTAFIFLLTIILRLRKGRRLADAAIDGLAAAYPNVAFLGFPLSLIVFGNDSVALTAIATIVTVCSLFGVAILVIEIGLQRETRQTRMALRVAVALLKSPLVLAPLLGGAMAFSGLALPESLETVLHLLGNAASPCALVALGLFLARRTEGTVGTTSTALLLVGLKLIAQPAVTWVLASLVFGLSVKLTHVAVFLAALPTGTGPFMLAELYKREASAISKAILISTIVAVATLSAYVHWLG